jgi:uncharacterized protein (DUF1501 family)
MARWNFQFSKGTTMKKNKHVCEHTTLSRREVLTAGAGLVGSLLVPHPWILRASAAAGADHSVIVIFLRGAIDPLSVLAPSRQSAERPAYDLARPQLSLKHGDLLALSGTSQFGINACAPELKQLMDQNKLKMLLGFGSTNPTTSHFSQQDNMEYGIGESRIPGLSGGMLNRALGGIQSSSHLPAVTLAPSLDKSLYGRNAAVAVRDLSATGLGTTDLRAIASMEERINLGWVNTAPETNVENAQKGHAHRAKMAVAVIRRAGSSNVSLSPTNGSMDDNSVHYAGFSQMPNAIRLLKAEPSLRFVTMSAGAWDDHFNMGPKKGPFELRLKRLSRALKALSTDLAANGLASKTTVLLVSEFGRTVKENANLGLDHGRGGLAMIMGPGLASNGSVQSRGFTLAPSNPSIAQNVLPVEYDYRNVFAEVLSKRLGVSNLTTSPSPTVQAVFPGLSYTSYGLLR